MFFWRIVYVCLFILGAGLLLLSAFSQNHTLLIWAFVTLGIGLIIWYIVEKLYANFTMPKSTQQKQSSTGLPLDNIIDVLID